VPRGNPSPKLAITVDPDVHARVVAAATAEGVSISAWMTTAARRMLLIQDGLRAVVEWEAEHGAFTADELRQARKRVAAELAPATVSRSA
jgi:DNA-binding IclR family transcriptional regulator